MNIEHFPHEELSQFRIDLMNDVPYAVEIHNLMKEGLEETLQYEPIPQIFEEFNYRFWQHVQEIILVKQDEIVVGVLALTLVSYFTKHKLREVDVYGLAVHKSYRKQGIATCLLEYLINWARPKDVHTISIDVAANNIPAINLYSKLGLINARNTMKLEITPKSHETAIYKNTTNKWNDISITDENPLDNCHLIVPDDMIPKKYIFEITLKKGSIEDRNFRHFMKDIRSRSYLFTSFYAASFIGGSRITRDHWIYLFATDDDTLASEFKTVLC